MSNTPSPVIDINSIVSMVLEKVESKLERRLDKLEDKLEPYDDSKMKEVFKAAKDTLDSHSTQLKELSEKFNKLVEKVEANIRPVNPEPAQHWLDREIL